MLYLSVRTVRAHVEGALRASGARDRTHLCSAWARAECLGAIPVSSLGYSGASGTVLGQSGPSEARRAKFVEGTP